MYEFDEADCYEKVLADPLHEWRSYEFVPHLICIKCGKEVAVE